MGTSDYIDLSLIKNQNKLAIIISEFFDKDELDCIDLSKLEKCNRDINEIQYIYYYKEFEDGKSIKIIDTLIMDAFPVLRFVTIRLEYNKMMRFDYRCNYSKNIINQLNLLFARVYNYKCWKADGDDHIIKSHIIKSFSDKMKKDLSSDQLEEAEFVITYLISDGSIKNDNEFDYNFSIEEFDFNILSNSVGLIKFSYKSKINSYWNSIFFTKTDTGISNIALLIRQALN